MSKQLGCFAQCPPIGPSEERFDSIHALACADEKTLYVANEFSYRFDKVVLQQEQRCGRSARN